ncbi:hypothetical protein HID58_092550, partial [Brassica napus]
QCNCTHGRCLKLQVFPFIFTVTQAIACRKLLAVRPHGVKDKRVRDCWGVLLASKDVLRSIVSTFKQTFFVLGTANAWTAKTLKEVSREKLCFMVKMPTMWLTSTNETITGAVGPLALLL